MSANAQFSESDPRRYTTNLKDILTDVIKHAREDVRKIHDPKA